MRAAMATVGLAGLLAPCLAPAQAQSAAHPPVSQSPVRPGAAADSRPIESAPANGYANAQKLNFNIAAQPLSQALREYAQQSGDQVVFYSEVGEGRQSVPVEGRYTPEEALQKLLENTGLKSQRVNSKTVAISAAQPRTKAAVSPVEPPARWRLAQAAANPPPQPVPAHSMESRTIEASLFDVEEIIVTGTAVAERTKFASSVAISTFNAADIAQLGAVSSAELIAAVPGFWVESTSGTTQGNVFARGIVQDGGYKFVGLMEDGIPLYPVFELSFYNPDQFVRVDGTIERVEALRGGTAPIFTTGAVGGTVNFVTRAPGAAREGTFRLGVSDYGSYRSDFAWSTPLAGEWAMAIGGYYRTSDGIRDPGYAADQGGQLRVTLARDFDRGELQVFAKYVDDRSLFVVPIPLTGKPSDPQALNDADAGTYSLHSEDLARAGLPASAREVGLQGSDLEDGIHPQLGTLGARWAWALNERLSLVNLARYTNGAVRFDAMFPGEAPEPGTVFAAERGIAPNYRVLATGAAYPASQLVQNHGHWVVDKQYEALQDDMRLNLALDTHALTLGLYLADYSMSDRWSLGNVLLMDVSDRPRRLLLPGVTDPAGFTQYSFFNLIADYDAASYSLYAADEWQIDDALRLDFGIRYDAQQIDGSISNAVNTDLDGDPATPWDNATSQAGTARRAVNEEFDNFSWSIGFNYELSRRHAVFGHYTDSARLPHFDNVRDGLTNKDPVANIELGYKVSLDTLVVFATLFQTEFDNVAFTDFDAFGTAQVRTAGTRTRGLELEGQLRPVAGLNMRFSLTWQDPEYRNFTGATFDNSDNVIRRIPRLMVRLTPTYSFLQNRARAYLTYAYAGERFANDENTVRLPAYHKIDMGLTLSASRNWSFQLAGDNLTDEVGLTEGNPRTDVGAGALGQIYMARPLFGRSFTGSVTYRY